MNITKAGIDDISYVMEIIRACISDMEDRDIYQWDINFYPSRDVIEEDVECNKLFILKDNNQHAAIFVLDEDQPWEYEKLQWSVTCGRALVIHRLAVHPSFQKKGIARVIMDFIEKYGMDNGYSCIRLDAFSVNDRHAVKMVVQVLPDMAEQAGSLDLVIIN